MVHAYEMAFLPPHRNRHSNTSMGQLDPSPASLAAERANLSSQHFPLEKRNGPSEREAIGPQVMRQKDIFPRRSVKASLSIAAPRPHGLFV